MIRNSTALLLTAAASTFALGATSAEAASTSATAKARILQPIIVTKAADLDFGTVITSASASTVVVSTAGARTCGTGGIVCSGTAAAASFNATGTTGASASVTIPSQINLASGANNMTVQLASSATTLNFVSGGNNFTVGGTLAVGQNQADGVYSGTFTVNVDYP